jgi:hypothetical protein
MERNVLGGAYIKFGREKRCTSVLVGNPEGQRSLEDPSVGRRIILKWIFGKWDGGMYWINLAQDTNRWRTLVNAKMKLRVPQNAGNFLTGFTSFTSL